jgi:hypothetical protein
VNGEQLLNRWHLDDDPILHEQVEAEAWGDVDLLAGHRDRMFSQNGQALHRPARS